MRLQQPYECTNQLECRAISLFLLVRISVRVRPGMILSMILAKKLGLEIVKPFSARDYAFRHPYLNYVTGLLEQTFYTAVAHLAAIRFHCTQIAGLFECGDWQMRSETPPIAPFL